MIIKAELTTETPKIVMNRSPPTPKTITAIAHCGISRFSSSLILGAATLGITESCHFFVNSSGRTSVDDSRT